MLSRGTARVNAATIIASLPRLSSRDSLPCSNRLHAECAAPTRDLHVRKSCCCKPCRHDRRGQRNERTPDVRDAVQPSVGDVHREKHPAGLQHSKYFCKRAILCLLRLQMMQHEHGNRRGKRFVWERQSRSVALHHGCVLACGYHITGSSAASCALIRWLIFAVPARALRIAARDAGRKFMAILQARDARRALPQFFRPRARPSSDFQNVLSELRALKKPRQHFPPRHVAPEGRRAKPVLETVHRFSQN